MNNPQTDQTVIAYPDIHRGICNGTELFDNGNRIEDAKCTAAGEYGILSKPMSVCAGKKQFPSTKYQLMTRAIREV